MILLWRILLWIVGIGDNPFKLGRGGGPKRKGEDDEDDELEGDLDDDGDPPGDGEEWDDEADPELDDVDGDADGADGDGVE